MKILVTGSAGFIGAEVVLRLLERGDQVIGIDNMNSYYDPKLKEARLARFIQQPNFINVNIDIADRTVVERIFDEFQPESVVHLAAQAGVRYSVENPSVYVQSNIVGFAHILEGCRKLKTKHLVYASSSSVYGANTAMPFSTHHNVDHPLSLYAASKKANELMAHSYSHLYSLPSTGLRFFTVYGPWGRPDMALFKFTKAIIEDRPIQVYNFGKHRRDFTFIDDIADGVIRVLDCPAKTDTHWDGKSPNPGSSAAPWRVYNIGNNQPIELSRYISALEDALGKKSRQEMLPMQAGDLPDTFADVTDLARDLHYRPTTVVEDGVRKFVEWYREYYKV